MDSSSFEVQLNEARDKFQTGLGRIVQVSTFTIYARIVFGTHKGRDNFLRDYSTEQIRGFIAIFPDLQEYIDKHGPREGYWRWTRSLPRKTNRLLYQQLVVFLVTIFEAFIADILILVFRKEPGCLSSGSVMPLEEIIELGDYDSVINYIATQRAANVLSGDWYKIVKEFNKLFNIDLSTDIEEKSVAEIFEIRHAVVHNVAQADQRFINKVGASEWGLRYSLNREIVINQGTLDRMIAHVTFIADLVHESLLNKFGKS